MKNLLNIFAFFIVLTPAIAQDFNYGIKGGTNYNFSGDLKELNVLNVETDDVLHKAKSIQGYHGGLWLKLGSDTFVKAEVVYTHFESEFSEPPIYTITTNKIDVPIVVGLKVLGPLYVFAGPDFQYILNEEFQQDDISKSSEIYKNFTTGMHLGIGVEFGSVSLDLRWDKGLTENNIDIANDEIDDYNFTIDNRPNQLVLSLNIALSGSN